jgi:hypothetical protein
VKEKIMAEYNTWKGYPVGAEIVPKNGWQKDAYEKGMRFFEPIPPAPRPLRDGTGDFVYDAPGKLAVWSAQLAAEYSTRSVRAEAEAAGEAYPPTMAEAAQEAVGEMAVTNVVELRPAA